MEDFNEFFRTDKTYDDVKIYQKQGFILSLKSVFLEKTLFTLWKTIDLTPTPSHPSPPAFLGLK